MRNFHWKLCKCACGVMHYSEIAGADYDRVNLNNIDCPDCIMKRNPQLPVRRSKNELQTIRP